VIGFNVAGPADESRYIRIRCEELLVGGSDSTVLIGGISHHSDGICGVTSS